MYFLEVCMFRLKSTSPRNESLNSEILRDGVYEEKGLIKLFTFLLLFFDSLGWQYVCIKTVLREIRVMLTSTGLQSVVN